MPTDHSSTTSTGTARGLPGGGFACACGALAGRRLFSAALAAGALSPAMAAIPECKRSAFTKAVPADQVEAEAGQQYRHMLQQAGAQRAVAAADNLQLQRLRAIAQRLIPQATECNERAARWRWEVNLLGNPELNAFCMPGGKIAFFWGILSALQLSDDEVAVIMGHEMAHALLEHAREQMGKNMLTQGGLRLGAALLGLGQAGDVIAQAGSQFLSLTYSRSDETEADRLGLVMAARAGYDPRAGVTLWKKMLAASGGKAPPKLLSTHPTNADRIRDIESRLPQLVPVYDNAPKPSRNYGPPPRRNAETPR